MAEHVALGYASTVHAARGATVEPGVRHVRTKPRCPWTNGKAERFNRTLAIEWAYAAVYDSSAERVAALPAWLHGYNQPVSYTHLTLPTN